MKYTVHVVPVLAAAGYAAAQQALYAQCGGIGWTGKSLPRNRPILYLIGILQAELLASLVPPARTSMTGTPNGELEPSVRLAHAYWKNT